MLDIRHRWGITPVCAIPAEEIDFHVPTGIFDGPMRARLSEWYWESRDESLQRLGSEGLRLWNTLRRGWSLEVDALLERAVPETYRYVSVPDYLTPSMYWTKFLSACVLYDPPVASPSDLETFAAYGGPNSHTASYGGAGAPRADVLPIRSLKDSERVKEDTRWFYEAAIDEMGKVLKERLEEIGVSSDKADLDIWDLYREAVYGVRKSGREFLNLADEYSERTWRTDQARLPYIDPSHGGATDENVRSARKKIKGQQERNSTEEVNTRDPLTAIQCALLYDHHNPQDSADRRRRTWTYQKLSDSFKGIESARAAEAHVRVGRELLARRTI